MALCFGLMSCGADVPRAQPSSTALPEEFQPLQRKRIFFYSLLYLSAPSLQTGQRDKREKRGARKVLDEKQNVEEP